MQRCDSLEELAQYLDSSEIRKYYDCKRECDFIKSVGRQKQLEHMREKAFNARRNHEMLRVDEMDYESVWRNREISRDDTRRSEENRSHRGNSHIGSRGHGGNSNHRRGIS